MSETPYWDDFLIVAEQMVAGNKLCLIIVTSHVQRELHRTFRAKLIARAVLKQCNRNKEMHWVFVF